MQLIVHRILKRVALAVSLTAVVLSLTASAVLAGEVKGPPAPPDVQNTNYNTAATSHANSACVFSGLNDHTPGQGPTDTQTQTPHDGPPGAPGHGAGDDFPIGCRGGSNPDNPPE
jgi:hypothetical protein